jgi:hypothetical protein
MIALSHDSAVTMIALSHDSTVFLTVLKVNIPIANIFQV